MSNEDVINSFLKWSPFGMSKEEKRARFIPVMKHLTHLHLEKCPEYKNVVRTFFGLTDIKEHICDIPFIPVRLFKHQNLKSIEDSDVVKTMTSSGTSGQSPSQIFLDKITAGLQVKILAKIMGDFFGKQRLPMLVIDCKATVSNRQEFSARTTGILGFSMFGRDIEYALDDDMSLNITRVQDFIDKHKNSEILLFGFTFIVWQHFICELEKQHINLQLEQGILLHGGGWKKLQSEAVEPQEFKERLHQVTGLAKVHNYYGMVEQTGSIFMECEKGHLHAPAWAEILIRDPLDFSVLPVGGEGLVQLLSVIPHSYPGHSILSEDVGAILGVDNCPCGRKGTYFSISGRLEQAEVRGCSDSYQQ